MKSLPILAIFLPSILGSCFEPGLLYAGPTLHEPHSIKVSSAENCQGLCQQVFECNHFSWYSDAMGWDEYDNDCVLYSSVEGCICLNILLPKSFTYIKQFGF